ncbi:MAG: hypothetical protein IJP71_00060 [Lachnospiraceae bacterium]|nr:hypothetical protein [Lachnospiraceae bacterium]
MSEEKSLKEQKLLELEEMKKQINVLKGKVTTLEAKKKDIEKDAEDTIGHLIYDKRKEIERSYSEVLKEAEQRLKVKEKEKADERKKNIDKVVNENTKETKESILYLKNHIKNILEEHKLPGFVNSSFYMGVWYPTNIGEWFIGVLVSLIILAIPIVISFVFAKDALIKSFPNVTIRYIIIALIYLGVIFVAGLIWLGIDKLTKKNIDVLKEIKELRKNIADNNKVIEKITKDTNKEMTDDKFDYTKIDREIEAGKLEVDNYRKKKEEAMNHFENVTVEEIKAKAKEEVEKKTKPIIDEIEQVKEELDTLQKKHDEFKLSIAGE